MFTARERERIRDAMLEAAAASEAIVGAALVGSAARGREDEWSDVDLALQLAPDADEQAVVDEWSGWIDRRYGVADSFDVFAAGHVRYRVFLLSSSLQLDVSFWPNEQFRATEEGFRLLFGSPAEPTSPAPPDLDSSIGYAWLHALHARSALGRARLWQAVMMLDGLRDQIVALACIRHGLNPWHGRDADRLPPSELAALAQSRATAITADALRASLKRLLALLLEEIERHDAERAASLHDALHAIADSADPPVA